MVLPLTVQANTGQPRGVVSADTLQVPGILQADAGVQAPDAGGPISLGHLPTGVGTGSAPKILVVTTAQRNNLVPVVGMIIFNTTTGSVQHYDGSVWIESAALQTIINSSGGGGYLAGSELAYSATGGGAANQVDFVRLWLPSGKTFNRIKYYLVNGSDGIRQVGLGLYDNAVVPGIPDPTNPAGVADVRLVNLTDTPPAAWTDFRSVTIGGGYTITTAGYYWLAMQLSHAALKVKITPVYSPGQVKRHEKNPGGFGLPAPAGATTNPSSALPLIVIEE